jgi:hypothetical protein
MSEVMDDFGSDAEGCSDDVTWGELCNSFVLYFQGKRKFKWLYEKVSEFRDADVVNEDDFTINGEFSQELKNEVEARDKPDEDESESGVTDEQLAEI